LKTKERIKTKAKEEDELSTSYNSYKVMTFLMKERIF